MEPELFASSREWVDRVLPDNAVLHQPPDYPRGRGTRIVRMKGLVLPPIVNAYALEAFKLSDDDPPMAPYIAVWLWRQRLSTEGSHGVLTASAWCVHCGQHFIDGRVRGGEFVTIAQWCSACRRSRTRHLPALLKCAADDCLVWFKPRRKNLLFCSPACKESARNADMRPAAPRRRCSDTLSSSSAPARPRRQSTWRTTLSSAHPGRPRARRVRGR